MKSIHLTCSAIFTIAVALRYVRCKDDQRNYKIAAILPLLEENSNYSITRDPECSYKLRGDALQTVEALYYALDLVQKDENVTRNFTLNIEIFETCGNKFNNVEHISKIYAEAIQHVTKNNNTTPLVGIIYSNGMGPFDYERLFKAMDLAQISISGPSKNSFNIDEIESYYTLFPTSGHFFILDVIFEILAHQKWKNIKLVGPNNFIGYDYQKSNFVKRAEELAEIYEVCISHTVSSDQLRTFGIYGSELLRYELLEADVVDIIICFCDANEIISLKAELEKFNKTNLPGKVVVIAGNTDESWRNGKIKWEPKLGDLYYVTPKQDQYVEEFYDYYTSLSTKSITKHAYLKEFRERYFEFFGSKKGNNEKSNSAATFKDTYKNNSRDLRTIESVLAMAHYLNDLDRFSSHEFKENRKAKFYEHMMTFRPQFPNFTLFGAEVSFTLKNLPTKEKFDVYKYEETSTSEPHNFTKIAEYLKYDDTEKKLFQKLEVFRIRGNLTIFDAKNFQYSKYHVKSECSEACPTGHRKELHRDQCCWDCVLCDDFTIPSSDATSCEKCKDGFVPSLYRNDCIPISIELPKNWTDGHNLISIGFSSFTIVLAVIISRIFFKYRHTPAVKSTTRQLCYIMLAGIILANFTILISALSLSFESSNVKTLPAIGFAMVFGALLMKTYRIARLLAISEDKFGIVNLKYLSVNAQIVITCILIGVEILICWLAVQTQNLIPCFEANDLILKKYYLNGVFFVEIFGFIGLLILLCTYYAIKTRKVPKNCNESKYIGFAMYATVLTVVAFSSIYFSTKKKILATHLCISINSLVILIFMFSHKLYIILCTPEKNSKINFSPATSTSRSYDGNEPDSALENIAQLMNNTDEKKEQVRNSIAKIRAELYSLLSTKPDTDEKVAEKSMRKDDLELKEAQNEWKKAYRNELVEKLKILQKELDLFQKNHL